MKSKTAKIVIALVIPAIFVVSALIWFFRGDPLPVRNEQQEDSRYQEYNQAAIEEFMKYKMSYIRAGSQLEKEKISLEVIKRAGELNEYELPEYLWIFVEDLKRGIEVRSKPRKSKH